MNGLPRGPPGCKTSTVRGRLLLYTLLMGLELAVFTYAVIDDGGLDRSTQVGLIPITFAMVISEVGRLNHGRVSSRWIVGLCLVAAAAVVVGTVGLVQEHNMVDQVVGVLMLVLAASVVPVVIVQSHRRRLGLPRRRVTSATFGESND